MPSGRDISRLFFCKRHSSEEKRKEEVLLSFGFRLSRDSWHRYSMESLRGRERTVSAGSVIKSGSVQRNSNHQKVQLMPVQ